VIFVAHASSSSGNLYAWIDDDSPRRAQLAVECGLPARGLRTAFDHRLSELDGVLLSHHHGDHSRGAATVLRSGVEVYASAPCLAALELLGAGLRAVPVAPRRAFTIRPSPRSLESWRVMPFPLKHDAEGALGFFVERRGEDGSGRGRLLYACDAAYLTVLPRRATCLAVECNYSEAILLKSDAPAEQRRRVLKSHLSLERLLGWLARVDRSELREVWLLHLSAAHSDAEAFRRAVEQAIGVPTHIAPRNAEFAARQRKAEPQERSPRP